MLLGDLPSDTSKVKRWCVSGKGTAQPGAHSGWGSQLLVLSRELWMELEQLLAPAVLAAGWLCPAGVTGQGSRQMLH